MARKRERFERSDVPRESPYRNLIGLVVLLVVGAVGFFFVRSLWGHVQVEAHMADTDIIGAIDEQPGPTTLEGNFEYTDNVIEKILFIQVDDADAEHPQFVSAQLLLLDEVGGTAHLVNVPSNVLLMVEGSSYAFSDYFNSFGPDATIPLITTAYNLFANHVIIGTSSPWANIVELDGENPLNVARSAKDFVRSMRTDLGARDLVEHAALFKTLGVMGLEVEETPVVGGAVAEGEEAPATVSVDLVPFGVQTGILIPYE